MWSWCCRTGIEGPTPPSIRNPVVNEERMRRGHWLGLVLYVPFSALTLMVGWQEGHPACKNTIPLIPEVLFWNRWRRTCWENWLTQVHPGKCPLNARSCSSG